MRRDEPLRGWRDPASLSGLAADTPLCVGFSGGADSVALLSCLAGKPVTALHVHHGMRGEEADRDAAFCRQFCEERHIPFVLLTVDVPRERMRGESDETAARRLRYAALTAWMKQNGVPLLLTAHHADDQTETMLMNLMRGAGTRGVSGIPACRPLGDGLLVARPLLLTTKADILAYVQKNGLPYVTDSTNEKDDCRRNRLRHTVLPAISAVDPDATRRFAASAARLAADEAYFEELAAAFLKTEGVSPRLSALAALPAPVLLRVADQLLPEPLSAVQFEALERLIRSGKPHASLSLPPRLSLAAENGRLLIKEKQPRGQSAPDYAVPLTAGGNEVPGGWVCLGAPDETPTPPRDFAYTVRVPVNTALLVGTPYLRPRRAGDVILAGHLHKAVRRLAGLSTLPPAVRATMPLLCDDAGVAVVPFAAVRDGLSKDAVAHITFFFGA